MRMPFGGKRGRITSRTSEDGRHLYGWECACGASKDSCTYDDKGLAKAMLRGHRIGHGMTNSQTVVPLDYGKRPPEITRTDRGA